MRTDETSAILKSHLSLEHALEVTICRLFDNPEVILETSFKSKSDFLYATGAISKDIYERLLLLNSIRNKFSHEYEYLLSVEEVAKLEMMFGSKIVIPEKLLVFPRAKEVHLFMTAVTILQGFLELLTEFDKEKLPKDVKKVIFDALGRVFSREK